jgi:hypothetical protein
MATRPTKDDVRCVMSGIGPDAVEKVTAEKL